MRIRLDYGKSGLDVELPDRNLVGPLRLRPCAALPRPEQRLREVLKDPIGTPPLETLARDRKSACILVCDITRPVPNELLLKPIVSTLRAAGIPQDAIRILIATGMHRPNEGDELVELVGAEIASTCRVENHFGKRPEQHQYLGQSPRGVPVWIDRRYLEADLKIATGLIEPHLMAGYSGGRKLICPGIAGLETVKVWHGPDFLEHPKAEYGVLDGNPVHEENTAIARMAGCDFIVNVTIDEEKNVTSIVAGDMQQAFLEGVRTASRVARAEVAEPCDVVVTTAAGYPLDTTFYQAVKGLTAALPIVRQGGTIVLAAGLSEGIGSPEFQQIFDENDSIEQAMERILAKDYFVMDQWQVEELAKACRQARIVVVTDGLDAGTLERLFVESSTTVEQAVADTLKRCGPTARIGVIPRGPYVLPVLKNGATAT